MRCVVTGAAGFIGSHLAEALLAAGHQVAGLDAFVPYYPRPLKQANLAALRGRPGFAFHEIDLRGDDLAPLLAGAGAVFHLAAMPGLLASWADLEGYWGCNVLATQRLLEALRHAGGAPRLVYASTSSVYGRFGSGDEALPTRPASPYGVSKLAAEGLCHAYAEAHGLPLVVLRYFSVYGPRQRPDMGYHRFIAALLRGGPVEVCGDGRQVRGNTYVADCVAATLAALGAPAGEVYNVGGGEAASVWDVLGLLEGLAGRPAKVVRRPERPGEQRHSLADTGKLLRHLGWRPATPLAEGLARQWQWQKEQL